MEPASGFVRIVILVILVLTSSTAPEYTSHWCFPFWWRNYRVKSRNMSFRIVFLTLSFLGRTRPAQVSVRGFWFLLGFGELVPTWCVGFFGLNIFLPAFLGSLAMPFSFYCHKLIKLVSLLLGKCIRTYLQMFYSWMTRSFHPWHRKIWHPDAELCIGLTNNINLNATVQWNRERATWARDH